MKTIISSYPRLLLLTLSLSIVGCDKLPDLPIGLGYAAKNLCSGLYVSGLQREHLINDLIAPQVQPLPLIWRFNIDEASRTVEARDVIFGSHFASKAYYREGYGCTLMHGATIEELDAQVTPRSTVVLSPDLLWPQGRGFVPEPATAQLQPVLDAAFAENEVQQRNTKAVVIVHEGRLIAERYADGVTEQTPLLGWSLTKSFTSTWIGMLVDRGWLALQSPAPVAEWQGTEKADITLTHLLHMAAGLKWQENAQGENPDQGRLLHLKKDFAGYYAQRPLAAVPIFG